MHLPIPVRELHAEERGLLLDHTLALSAEDRRLRFEHPLSDDAVRRYIEAIDLTRDVVFVATSRKLAVVGAAHLARTGADQAELGISVLERARGKGIGDALMERCITRARVWGVRVMFMHCLLENGPMMHLARKKGLTIASSGAEAEAFVRLPRSDLANYASDALSDHIGLFDYALKSHWLALRTQFGALPGCGDKAALDQIFQPPLSKA